MKDKKLKKRLEYWVDSFMEQGTVVMILLLFIVVVLFACIVGIIVSIVCGVSFDEGIWNSLMHTLDAGNLAGNDLGNKANIVLMSVVTLFGLCFTGGLISIINNSFEQKVKDLQKGTSKVMENGHVVVLGYNEILIDILESLVEANSNQKRQCIVVVGDKDNEEMNADIKAKIKDQKHTKIRCRSGKIYERHMLDLASIENAKAVIINANDDKNAIKALIAVHSYLEDNVKSIKESNCNNRRKTPVVTVVINDELYLNAAEIEGRDWAKVICGKEAISRIIAHSCNQRGLCKVFDELFDYKNNEIYFETIQDAAKKKFKEIVFMFGKAIPIGIYSPKAKYGEKVKLNPDPETEIADSDQIIMFEEDDKSYKYEKFFKNHLYDDELNRDIKSESIIKENTSSKLMMDLIVLGQNDSLDAILREYNEITYGKTSVRILDRAPKLKYQLGKYDKIDYSYIPVDDFNDETIISNVSGKAFNILVLADYALDYEEADAESILKLIELKKLADKTGRQFAKTCEIRKSTNKPLAEIVGGENFVISSNIGGLMSVQCAEDDKIFEVFKELLSAKGSELYMKPVEDFVRIDEEVNFNTVLEAALEKNSICLGYYKNGTANNASEPITCPDRFEKISFEKGDTLIILSENW